MIVIMVLVVMLLFLGMSPAGEEKFYEDYISPKQTNAINGAFVLLIFISHACSAIDLSGVLDQPYVTMKTWLNQLVVVTFLFYSGYGIMESIKKKGKDYVKTIPTRRFLRVLYHLDIAVLMFVIINPFIERHYGIKETLLAFTGWGIIGNSNWYIFAILVLYAFTFLAFMIARKRYWLGALIVTVLSVVYVYFHIMNDSYRYNYNTFILFSVGLWYSLFKEKIERVVMKNNGVYSFVFMVTVLLFYYFYTNNKRGIEWFSAWCICFMALVLLTTMKFKFDNSILQWLGKHTFSIYVLQKIPMNILQYFGFNKTNKYAFIVISFVITVFIAELFDRTMVKLDSFIYKPRKKQLPQIQNV